MSIHSNSIYSHLIMIQLQGIINLNMQESLYTHLLDAYLNYYLPLCGVVPISPKFLQLKEVLGCQQSGT